MRILVAQAHADWGSDLAHVLAGKTAEDIFGDDSSSLSSLSSLSSPSPSAADDNGGGDASLSAALSHRIDRRDAMENEALPFNTNIEQERRDGALAFRLRIENVHEVVLSISEAVLLLYLAEWDIGVALAQFQSHEEARNRLRVAFDSMRGRTDDLNEQSARLAAMLDICERADWLSFKLFLLKKRHNLVRAVIAWYKTGVPPFKNDDTGDVQKKDRLHWRLRVDHNGRLREMPTSEECLAAPDAEAAGWAHDTDDFTNPGDTNPPTPHSHSQGHGRNYNTAKDRPPGFILHAGKESFTRMPLRSERDKPDTIQPGPADPSKFLLEYISKGQYKFNLFKLEKYFFSDRIDDAQDDPDDADDAGNKTRITNDDTLVNDDTSSSSSDFDPSPSKPGTRKRELNAKSTSRAAATPRKRAKTIKPCVEFDFETISRKCSPALPYSQASDDPPQISQTSTIGAVRMALALKVVSVVFPHRSGRKQNLIFCVSHPHLTKRIWHNTDKSYR